MIDLDPIRRRLRECIGDWATFDKPSIPVDSVFVQHVLRDLGDLILEVEILRADNDRLIQDLEDAKMGYCPMCDVFGGCAHTSEGEE